MKHKTSKLLSILLALALVMGIAPAMSQTAQAAGTNKAIQLVDHSGITSVAANIEGGQKSVVYFGKYKQSPDGSGDFNKEPIKWRVLENAEGKLLLLSDQNLEVMRYHNDYESVTWEKSTMRSWLNGYDESENNGDEGSDKTANAGIDYSSDSFIGDAFAAEEQAAIAETVVENPDNGSTPGGNDTTDKVFLLSIDEVMNSDDYGFTDDNSRISTNTGYVAAGGRINMDGMYGGVGEADIWWLRSPGYNNNYAALVNSDGFAETDVYGVGDTFVAVRPAFHLNLSSVLFTSAAADGKAGTTGELSEIGAYNGNDWKLTLKDDARQFAVTETAVSGIAGETVTLHYTGATLYEPPTDPYANEYISAILTDKNGNPLRYGRLTQPSATDGKVDVKIPAGLAEGTYILKVFSEQYNGALFTDYASAFDDVTLTVVKAAGISVNNSDITLPYGDQSTIVVTTDPAGLAVEFIPNGDGFVSVDENGFVTALKLGVTTITVKLIPPYVGETTVMVTVVPRLITEADFTALPTETKTYNASEQTQAVASYLTEGIDYEVEYTANTNAGTASYTVKGKGNYTGTITKQFTINKADPMVSDVTVTAPSAIYADTPIGDIQLGFTSNPTGGSIKLDDGQTLTVGTKDYNWTYTPADTANYNTATGKVSVTVTGTPPQPTTKHTVTYIVVNGTWADGTTTPKTEEVEDGQSPAQIPSGMIASEGFEGGAWSPDPTSATITDTASFTYTFTAKQNPPGPVTVTGIKLNSNGAKKLYTEGEALDVTGLTLEVSKSDGSKSTVDVTAAMISGFDSSKTGTQTLTVSYEGFTATYEVEVKAETTPPSPTYEATVQAVTWQKGSGKNLNLTFKRSEDDHLTYGLFGSLEIGSVTVGSANYDTAEGSLKLSVKPEYLETLSVGDHTVKVNFQDGSATVNLTVKAAATQPTPKPSEKPDSPKTGDESNLALHGSLMFLSVVVMVVLLLCARKRETEK